MGFPFKIITTGDSPTLEVYAKFRQRRCKSGKRRLLTTFHLPVHSLKMPRIGSN